MTKSSTINKKIKVTYDYKEKKWKPVTYTLEEFKKIYKNGDK